MRKSEGKKKNVVEAIAEGDINDAVLTKWEDDGIHIGLTQKGVVLIKRGLTFSEIIERRVIVKEDDMNVSKMEYMHLHVNYISNKLLRDIMERETEAVKRRGRGLLAQAKRDELKKKYVEKLEKELKPESEQKKPDEPEKSLQEMFVEDRDKAFVPVPARKKEENVQ